MTALEVLARSHPRSVLIGPFNDLRQVSGRDVSRLIEQQLAEPVWALGIQKARLTAQGVSLCQEEGWL
jgi:hypothetical protein